MSNNNPGPILNPLIASDSTLSASWINHPYYDINNANLMIVDTNTNTIRYQYLTEEEAVAESYIITGLTNGHTYMVCYTQVQLTPDGTSGNSNTETGTPLALVNALTINSVIVQPGLTSVNANVTFGDDNGYSAEKVLFTIVNEDTNTISTQIFDLSENIVRHTLNFVLTNLTSDKHYLLTVQAINNTGWSNISNVKEFSLDFAPQQPTLSSAMSGMDQTLSVLVSGLAEYDSHLYPITSITVQASIVSSFVPSSGLRTYTKTGLNLDASYNNVLIDPTSGDWVDLSGANNSLVNGLTYYIRAHATNISGDSLWSVPTTAVPASRLTFSNVVLSLDSSHNHMSVDCSTNNFTWSNDISLHSYAQANFWRQNEVAGEDDVSIGQTQVANPAASANITFTIDVSSNDFVGGDTYYVILSGYASVPQARQTYWLNPALPSTGTYNAIPTYSNDILYTTVPGPVQNISYAISQTPVTNNTQTVGTIDVSWNAPDTDGGLPITGYSLKLYDMSNNQIDTANVSEPLTCRFYSVDITKQYSVVIWAENDDGSSQPAQINPIVFLPDLPTVSSFNATQQASGNSSDSQINLTWEYPGSYSDYDSITFNITESSPDGLIATFSVDWNAETTSYSQIVSVSSPSVGQVYSFTMQVVAVPNPSFNSADQSSQTQTTSVILAAGPLITDITTDASSNTFTFTINKHGSDIIPNSLFFNLFPSDLSTTGDFGITKLDETLVNSASNGIYTYVNYIPYVFNVNEPTFLIVAVNSISGTIATGGAEAAVPPS